MTYSVAAEKQGVSRGFPKSAVQIQNNLGIGQGLIVKMPSSVCDLGTHTITPPSKEIIGGEVMLDQFITPRANAVDVSVD